MAEENEKEVENVSDSENKKNLIHKLHGGITSDRIINIEKL